MTQVGSRLHQATRALDGILLASVVTTFLAPTLAHIAGLTALGFPLAGLMTSFFVGPQALIGAPLLVVFLFVVFIALGWLLEFWGARHIAAYMLASGLVGLAAWGLTPALVGQDRHLPFLTDTAAFGEVLRIVPAMAAAGALNGAIYWLILCRLARRNRALSSPRP